MIIQLLNYLHHNVPHEDKFKPKVMERVKKVERVYTLHEHGLVGLNAMSPQLLDNNLKGMNSFIFSPYIQKRPS